MPAPAKIHNQCQKTTIDGFSTLVITFLRANHDLSETLTTIYINIYQSNNIYQNGSYIKMSIEGLYNYILEYTTLVSIYDINRNKILDLIRLPQQPEEQLHY